MQARKLESELDVKVAAYGKLCAGYESSYAKGESGLAQDQVQNDGACLPADRGLGKERSLTRSHAAATDGH